MMMKYFFLHSNWGRLSHFDNRNSILTLESRPNIAFLHSISYFEIRTWGRMLHFDRQNPILTFELGPNIAFDI